MSQLNATANNRKVAFPLPSHAHMDKLWLGGQRAACNNYMERDECVRDRERDRRGGNTTKSCILFTHTVNRKIIELKTPGTLKLNIIVWMG